MSCYYNSRRMMLVLRCDSCGRAEDIAEKQTDRLLKHEWIREHGWKTVKTTERFADLCEDCKRALEEKKRQDWINSQEGKT